MKCCGYYHPQEYLNISGLYPPSCCDRSGKAISLCIEPYPTGCWPRFVEVATKYGVAYGGFVGFEVIVIMIDIKFVSYLLVILSVIVIT